MIRVMFLDLGMATLRSLDLADAPSLARHANNPRIWRNLRERFPFPYEEHHAGAWIRHVRSQAQETSFALARDGEAIGCIGLEMGQDVYRRSAEIGYWIGEAFWGQGIATAAVRSLTRHAFTHLDLWRIHAAVFQGNPASEQVLGKAGFQKEGCARQAVLKDGQLLDEFRYALLREKVS